MSVGNSAVQIKPFIITLSYRRVSVHLFIYSFVHAFSIIQYLAHVVLLMILTHRRMNQVHANIAVIMRHTTNC